MKTILVIFLTIIGLSANAQNQKNDSTKVTLRQLMEYLSPTIYFSAGIPADSVNTNKGGDGVTLYYKGNTVVVTENQYIGYQQRKTQYVKHLTEQKNKEAEYRQEQEAYNRSIESYEQRLKAIYQKFNDDPRVIIKND